MCTESHDISNPYCPTDGLVTKVGIVRPVPFESDNPSDYPADRQYEIIASNACTIHNAYNDGNAVVEPDPEEQNPLLPATDPDTNPLLPDTDSDRNPLLPPVTDPNANNNSNNSNGSGSTSSSNGNSSSNSNSGNSNSSNTNSSNNNSNSNNNVTTTPVEEVTPPATVPDYVETLNP